MSLQVQMARALMRKAKGAGFCPDGQSFLDFPNLVFKINLNQKLHMRKRLAYHH